MGYGQRLRVQRSADGRVLRAQLTLAADILHGARFSAPLAAMAIALLGSLPSLGSVPLSRSLLLPLAICAVMLVAMQVVGRYRKAIGTPVDPHTTPSWFTRLMAVQIAVSAVWGLLPWLMWQPDNAINHLYVAFVSVGVLSWLIVSRVGHVDIFLGSIIPMLSLTVLRFLTGGSIVDLALAGIMAIYTVQMVIDGRRLTYRLDEDTRLRFEVEDLAREIEEARDEALRKRFEAETANASKTTFLANMSHELRTPLNVILGFSEIIAQQCFGAVGNARYVEYAGDIHASGTHLLSLINDLLDVAKIEAGRMEIQPAPLDARKTIESALKLVGAKAREHHQTLVIETTSDAPELFADERALKQILINLVANAVKFTPKGGQITVLGSRARDGGFQIMVEDNGPGIPPEKLNRILKPFSQVDNRYDRQGGGTGLGLALVRGLSELHGGRAWLESEYGKGCRAYVVLPPAPSGNNDTEKTEQAAA